MRSDSNSWPRMHTFGKPFVVRRTTPCPDPIGRAHCRGPLTIPNLLTLETLADVRALVEKHLPAEYRAKFTWRQLAGLPRRAAEGQQDVAEVAIALRIVLQLEGIKCA